VKNTIFLILIILFSGCQSAWRGTIPDVEILYQNSLGPNKIGFVDADGKDPSIFETGTFLRKPVWSSDGTVIYALTNPSPGRIFGYPAYWDTNNGKFKACRRDLPYFWQIEESGNANGRTEVLLHDSRTVISMELANCTQTGVLLDVEKRPGNTSQGYPIIEGFSYHSPTRQLLIGLVIKQGVEVIDARIIKFDQTSGEWLELAEGINPSWSPDGHWIAYVGLDGLYVMRSDGTGNRQVLEHLFFDFKRRYFGGAEPKPKWSPDGKWLVYHRCEDISCIVTENTIYKISADGGQEEEIIFGGAFPSWKP
jgi:hypothetical protein